MISTDVFEFNPEEQSQAYVKMGQSVKVFCSITGKMRHCLFRGPQGDTYTMSEEGEKYENSRIENYLLTDRHCGMQIHSLEEKDRGKWECLINYKDTETGQSANRKEQFKLAITGYKQLCSAKEYIY